MLARKGDVRVDTVPDPKIQHRRDAAIKITACAICGSDLHLLDGYQPTMASGDILGHENMGEVIELGLQDLAREMEFRATTDTLTGLFNRLKFNQTLAMEILRSKRY